MDKDIEARNKLCISLGFKNLVDAHEIIMACAKHKDHNTLLRRKLNSKNLVSLGYSMDALKQLGYTDSLLKNIGFDLPDFEVQKQGPLTNDEINSREKLDELVKSGYNASQLRAEGMTIRSCKLAGCSAGEVMRLGFPLAEIAREYTVNQLRSAGFRVQDLRSYFNGRELREAGYTANEMKNAGFGIEELRKFGYNDNLLVDARFSNRERVKAGLSKRVKDNTYRA